MIYLTLGLSASSIGPKKLGLLPSNSPLLEIIRIIKVAEINTALNPTYTGLNGTFGAH